MKTWADFVPSIAPFVPECPSFTIQNAVRECAIRFYTDSRAWRSDNFALATTVAGQQIYTVALPDAYRDLIGLPAIWVDGDEVDELPPGGMDEEDAGQTSNTFKVGVYDPTVAKIVCVPAPIDAGLAIVATVAYAPTKTATGIDDGLYRDHRVVIEPMAKSYLMMQLGKKWFNPQLGAVFNREAMSEAAAASALAGPVRRRAAFRTRSV